MEFLAKMTYYIMFGLSGLVCLFNCANALYIASQPAEKLSEVIILLLAGLLTATGMYLTYLQVMPSEKYLLGCGLLGLTWLCVLIELFVGFFFFNGPLHWQ